MARVLLISLYEVNYLGTRILASWLRAHGHETRNVFFKDMAWEYRQEPEEQHRGYQYVQNGHLVRSGWDIAPYTETEVSLLAQAIQHFKPDLVGLSARSPYDEIAFELAPALRSAASKALLVAGGHGPTLRPESYLEHGFDVVVRGDGEEALLELVNHLSDPQYRYGIANTSWRLKPANDSHVGDLSFFHNPLRPQEKNINRYPPPLHGDQYCVFIDKNSIWEQHDPSGAAYITFTTKSVYSTCMTRGCAGRCTYCSGGQWAAQYHRAGSRAYKCRVRDIWAVLKELEQVDRHKYGYIDFVDECFALTEEKAFSFFREYKKRIGLPFSMYLHYEKMLKKPRLFELIVDAGLDHSEIGVQTGSERFAAHYYKRSLNNTIYIQYAWMLFNAFVSSSMHFIGGNCYEQETDFLDTLNFIKQLPYCITNPRRNALVNVRLKMFPHSPLAALAPRTITRPMPVAEWWRRALLMELRRIVDDEEMETALNNRDFSAHPELLRDYYQHRLHRRQVEYFVALLPRLKKRRVVFMGLGQQYRANKYWFTLHGVQPSVFVVNKIHLASLPVSVDGVPVRAAEDMFDHMQRHGEDVEVVIFSEQATAISRSLIRRYGMEADRLHPCATHIPLLPDKS